MHVAIDARTNTPHFPGIGRYTFNLLRALQPLTTAQVRLTALRAGAAVVPPEMATLPMASGPFSLSQQWRLPAVLRQQHIDVYHSLYYCMPYYPRLPTVLTVYDVLPWRYPQQVSRSARLLFPHLLRLALHSACQVIVISEATRRDLSAFSNVVKKPLHVIPLAPEACFFPQPEAAVAAFRQRLDLPSAYVLYVGTARPHKNLARLIDAWTHIAATRAVSDWTLVIAGPWETSTALLQQRVAQSGLERRVRFLGPVSAADLPLLYSGAGLFVFPSLYEGFGLPVIEAMACGVPVACSQSASLPEVGGEAAWYFDPLDVAAIATTLRTLLGSAILRQDMQQAALQQAARFAWEATAQQTLEVYRAALAS